MPARKILNQKVNFYACVGLIAAFGFFAALTIVQSFNKNAPLVAHISSPIDLNYDYARY